MFLTVIGHATGVCTAVSLAQGQEVDQPKTKPFCSTLTWERQLGLRVMPRKGRVVRPNYLYLAPQDSSDNK
eukprot:5578755-Amphidinium_carterae.1